MLITRQDDVLSLSEKLKLAPPSCKALDTEFSRNAYYRPKLCLLQLHVEEETFVIDSLAESVDISPLRSLFYDPSILKVVHGAFEDFEIFYHLWGYVPQPFFDTQIAASLLGFGKTIGYKNLVKHYLSIEIDKTFQYVDWEQRPLNHELLDYAKGDVTHLYNLYPLITENLKNRDLYDDALNRMTPDFFEPRYPFSIKRLFRKLRPQQLYSWKPLTILEEILLWRETIAEHNNAHRSLVLNDHFLLHFIFLDFSAQKTLSPPSSLLKFVEQQEWTNFLDKLSLIEAWTEDEIKQQKAKIKSWIGSESQPQE